jgi:hypothetical protein
MKKGNKVTQNLYIFNVRKVKKSENGTVSISAELIAGEGMGWKKAPTEDGKIQR